MSGGRLVSSDAYNVWKSKPLVMASSIDTNRVDGESVPEEISFTNLELKDISKTDVVIQVPTLVLKPTGVRRLSNVEFIVHTQKVWLTDDLEIAAALYTEGASSCKHGDSHCEKTGQTVDLLTEARMKEKLGRQSRRGLEVPTADPLPSHYVVDKVGSADVRVNAAGMEKCLTKAQLENNAEIRAEKEYWCRQTYVLQ